MWLLNFFLFSNFILSGWFVVIFFLIFRFTKNFYGSREKPVSWMFIMSGMVFLGFATFTSSVMTYIDPNSMFSVTSNLAQYGIAAYLVLEYAALSALMYGFVKMNREITV